jgi:hypothetical protein
MGKLKLITILSLAFVSFASNSYSDTTTAASTSPTVINEKLEMAENNPIANTFCKVYKIVLVTGFIVVIILWTVTGIGFFIGKISWGIVIAVACGSFLMVSSGKLAAKFVLGDSSDIQDACDCRYGVNCDSPYE